MYDARGLIKRFHNEHVRLTSVQSAAMRQRRDANIDRVKAGLDELKKPKLVETISQGGYAMDTMTQPPEGDEHTRYDIDVGVVFEHDDAKTPGTTKGWVRDALVLKGDAFKTTPVAKKKCVRVVYEAGYQVDLPVIRRKTVGNVVTYEIAVGDEWNGTDPAAVNNWFDERVKALSPDASDGYQLRRIVRLLKYFAKVRASKSGLKFPAGLVVTALAVECYRPVSGRDDEAFYETLSALSRRSEFLLVMANGTVISGDKDRERIKRLSSAAKDAVDALTKLAENDPSVTDEEARKAWKKVFSHSFFDPAVEKKSAADLAAPAILAALTTDERLALAREKVRETPRRTKPWAP